MMEDFDIINRVFCSISDKVDALGLDGLLPEERNIYLVWAALGVIENGSFHYFFENNMDPVGTAKAFKEIGLADAAECFCLAESLLPADFNSADFEQQKEVLNQHEEALDKLAMKIVGEGKQAESKLGIYISQRKSLLSHIKA